VTARSRNPRSAPAGRRRALTVLVGVAVIAAAVVIAVLTVGDLGDRIGVEELAGSPAISGEPLPQAPQDPTTDPAIGTPAPVVTGRGFDDLTTTIGEPGRGTVVLFLASWCPACQQELPEVVTWLGEGRLPDGVRLVAVVTGLDDTRPNWPPDAWLEAEGYDGAVVVDDADGSIARAYGLSGTPFWVALDEEGRVAVRVAGLLSSGQLDLLAGRVAPVD
jgi:cytochrome c biogenesis protein CcmG, thiol:disulfide interchange protein DsbE